MSFTSTPDVTLKIGNIKRLCVPRCGHPQLSPPNVAQSLTIAVLAVHAFPAERQKVKVKVKVKVTGSKSVQPALAYKILNSGRAKIYFVAIPGLVI